MKRFLIAASAAASALSASASADVPPIRFERDTARIYYQDLDVASQDGRAQLVRRIRKAAERICADYDGGVPSFANFRHCYQALVKSGVDQIGDAAPAKHAYASNAFSHSRRAGRGDHRSGRQDPSPGKDMFMRKPDPSKR